MCHQINVQRKLAANWAVCVVHVAGFQVKLFTSSAAIYYQAAIDWILLTPSYKCKKGHSRHASYMHKGPWRRVCAICKIAQNGHFFPYCLYVLCVTLGSDKNPCKTEVHAHFPQSFPPFKLLSEIKQNNNKKLWYRISLWQCDHSAQFEVRKKKDVLNLWGPVRGSFTLTGARRALDLAEVRLPLGRSLQGLLVLLISGHDRSAPVQPELLSFLFLSPFLPFPYALVPLCSLSSLSPSSLAHIFSSLLSPISLALSLPLSRLPSFFFFSPSLCLLCCLIEVELRGGCSWRGPPCLVITSLFITHANGPRGEGNNNKLIEYELQLNRNLQHFILDRPVLWQMKQCSD